MMRQHPRHQPALNPPPVWHRARERGLVIAYHPGMACPGCGHSGWLIGRRAAECARCGTALPLPPAPR